MKIARAIALAAGILCLLPFSSAYGAGTEAKWAIHEWGTFTSLQDETGEAIGGINTDDEPVPNFVHRLADYLLLTPTEIPSGFFQGAPSCHPDVTMRLETPVIYFHPPKSEHHIQTLNVQVKFRGGWLSEFYPDACPEAPGFNNYDPKPFGAARLFQFGPLPTNSESTLTWDKLKVGGDWPLTNTTARVWTSPRAVQAASVQATNGESEKFLFYRGVGHLNAPLKISRGANSDELLFRSQLESLPADQPLTIRSLWLADIKPDGKIAFRTLPPVTLNHDPKKILLHAPAVFTSGDFSSGNLEKLKAALQQALIGDGLFADEAAALLNTWELSYFKSSGLRAFFLVPRAWTDFHLPLETSLPAEINRVMVGRIELVTPDQRTKLREISRCSQRQIKLESGQLFTNFYGKITFNPAFGGTSQPSQQEMQQLNKDLAQVNAGQKSLAAFISVPKGYQTYLNLGRFRNALILDEEKRHSTPSLTNFIATYRLEPYNLSKGN